MMATNTSIEQLLHLADNSLILGHRNSEWCGHGPVLEQDIAISNIALDLLGQARNFYQHAANLINADPTIVPQLFNSPALLQVPQGSISEDSLAYLRDVHEFRNGLLVEQPNGHWGHTILRQFFFSAYQYFLLEQLQSSKDEQVAAIAAKSIKETQYHLRWSSEWVVRLGDGTEESKTKMLEALDDLWMFSGEFFVAADYETEIDFAALKTKWLEKVSATFESATLPMPTNNWMQEGGKQGRHTEHLGYILAEMQYLQRAYPGAEW
jgi:ring-1,2-phenylacetyl-CoA epoxidase subunit PaaC